MMIAPCTHVPTAAITEPIEFNIGYELWGFAPVECEGAPEQTGTFLTNQCIDLSAYDGKFTLEISSACIFAIFAYYRGGN